jgi:hypothetical protein
VHCWQVFGLAGVRTFPTDHRFPVALTSALMMVFVPAYRCGAVPDLHRIPSFHADDFDHQHTNSDHNIQYLPYHVNTTY